MTSIQGALAKKQVLRMDYRNNQGEFTDVESPEELKNEISEVIEELQEHYGKHKVTT